jgi:hypothetical protein
LPIPKLSDAEFIALWRKLGTTRMAKEGHGDYANICKRRRRIERRHRISLVPPVRPELHPQTSEHPGWINLQIKNGIVLVGSDAHLWPGPMTTAMRAFVKFIKHEKPAAVVLNGDVMDFPRISRHPPIGWEKTPTPQDEIEAAQEILHEIEKAAGKARKLWTLGNHDARFATRLASVAPEYAKVHGVHLQDHFPLWEPSWAIGINDDVVIKHRHKGGIHATHNSPLWAGRSTVTGHLHSLKVSPLTDYNGTRYGVDTGCLADTNSRAFLDYTEANPLNWRSGFVVLTFKDGKLLWPETVSKWDENRVQWRGQLIEV